MFAQTDSIGTKDTWDAVARYPFDVEDGVVGKYVIVRKKDTLGEGSANYIDLCDYYNAVEHLRKCFFCQSFQPHSKMICTTNYRCRR